MIYAEEQNLERLEADGVVVYEHPLYPKYFVSDGLDNWRCIWSANTSRWLKPQVKGSGFRLYACGAFGQLGKEFNMSRQHVTDIREGRSWEDVS